MMSRLATITFALSLALLPVHGIPIRSLLGSSSDSVAPGSSLESPLVCPGLGNCSAAQTFCLSNTGTSGYMNFTCHSGSELGTYECATGPLTNCTGNVTLNSCELLPIVLGNAGQFGVLAGSTVTNSGPTKVLGHVGVSPGTAVTGFLPGKVVGGEISSANGLSASGIADLLTAYNFAAGLVLCPITKIGDLGGMTLPPGLYKSTSGMEVTTSDLYLDAEHDTEAVWVFQMATTFKSATSTKIILLNGAKASNIFWQVGSSGTIGAYSTFEGTMMADQAISVNTLAVVNGRLLARIAAVSLMANVVTVPE